ncbi:MAG: precorrin-3B C(17)-methyltransferase [Victivallales bacterium]|nr:precorrin-3B C(17)-methyltransferase [Victivallales bacterium]
MNKPGIIYAIGLGPGLPALLTPAAREAITACDVIAGYTTYLRQFPELFAGKKLIGNGMRGEMERCRRALNATLAGHTVGVVSSGDAGIYGMAGLLLELTEHPPYTDIEVVTIPGLTAAVAAAAILGAPLMNDFCVISLSDLMTPANLIRKRLHAAAAADLVTALYNPASTRRRALIREAVAIFTAARGNHGLAGIVHAAARPEQQRQIVRLADFPFASIDMNTLVIIGNSATVARGGKLFTRRGYLEPGRQEEKEE